MDEDQRIVGTRCIYGWTKEWGRVFGQVRVILLTFSTSCNILFGQKGNRYSAHLVLL